jgi:integrase
MRGQGRVFRPKVDGRESQVWWLDYSIRGKRHRESSGTTGKKEAFAKLRERVGKRTDGTLTGRPERITLADLRTGLQRHYLLEANASWDRASVALSHVEKYFGETARAIDVTRDAVSGYQEARIIEGAAHNTVRYETGVLRAAFTIAVDKGLLPMKPSFPMPGEGAARSGFFGSADFAALIVGLPVDVADVVRFGRMTGWRRGEITGLLWSQVEWDDDQFPGEHAEPMPGINACIRIGASQTKGDDDREFPFSEYPELRDLLVARWRARNGLCVFHRGGKPVGNFRKSWARACTNAGIPDRIFHDLRRTAARDFRQAGVSEGEIMRLCGWKTRAMFDRYNIVNNEDSRRAVRMRVNGKGMANKPVEAELLI